MKNIFFLILFLVTSVFAGTEAILKADQVDGLESVKNYMKEKAHFEKNVNGWSAYADAAGTRPVDGTGGSPTITCTRSTSSPITGDGSLIITKDAANRQGQGCAAQFTIGNEMKAKVMQLEVDYRVVSGTFAAGSSTTDSDLIVYLYDQTNSTLIEPSSIKFLSTSTTLPDKFVANFQTSATGTTYNLIIHAASTSASAYVVMLDNFKATPSRYVYGTPITDWVSYTPTGSFTNTTYTGKWRRVGDSIEAFVYAIVNNVSGPAPATFSVNYLPSGLTADSTKLNQANGVLYGYASILDSASRTYTGSVVYNSASSVKVIHTETGSNGDVSDSAPFTFTINDSISLHLTVPIQGWSSSTQQSDGYDGRQIGARYYNSASSISVSSSTITFTTREQDDTNSYSGGTYTVPSPGWYRTSAGLQLLYTSAADVNNSIAIFVDGSERTRTQSNTQRTTANDYLKVDDTIYLRAGQLVTIRASSSGTSPSINSDNARNFFSIVKSQAPTTISATEVVAASYTGTSGTITAGGTRFIVDVPTKVYDTHNAVTTGASWKFTAPISGIYTVKYISQHASATYTTGAGLSAELYKNGSFYSNLTNSHIQQAATTVGPMLSGSMDVSLNAGDYIDVREAIGGSVAATINSSIIAISRVK